MTIVQSLDILRDWAEEHVCEGIRLKAPDQSLKPQDGDSYPYKLVTPAAFSLFIPGKDRLPPNVHAPIPALCVELMEGADNLQASMGEMRVRWDFAAWNPGLHGPDIIDASTVHADVAAIGQEPKATDASYEGLSETFVRNSEGWRDVWNFVDRALRKLESTEWISGLRVMREQRIRYGPFAQQDDIVDYYPHWFAWIEFSVAYGFARNNPELEQYL